MAVLANAQWEMFCRELVELQLSGDKNPRAKAYERAGYAVRNAVDNARRLANRPEVKARIKALFEQALEYRDVRAVTVVTRIDRIARANVADFFERIEDSGGHPRYRLKDLTKLPRELTDALASIEWDEDGNPKIKLWDKNQANFTLLKHLGGLPEDSRPRGIVNIFAGLSVDDQRALAEALEALPTGAAVDSGQAAGERGEA